MEPKKISFGFSKSNKKPSIIAANKTAQKTETKIELIKCLEGQEIKLIEEKHEETPLVIPLKESQKTSAALASLMKRRAVLLGEDDTVVPSLPTESEEKDKMLNETDDIEKRAARELLAELKADSAEKSATELILPVVHPDDLPLEGAKESSLDDYEEIPIEQFGKAMLRGMGWVEPPKPAKSATPLEESPMVRPKGMGLGADKALKAKPLLVAPESNEVLQVKRNAFVRILGGKHQDLYGQIEGFDDHAGRVIVKMAIGGFKEAFNEFLCQPVSRKEYAQYGKCINSTKYEEYKRKENEHGQIILKKEEIAEIDKRSIKYEKLKTEKKEPSSDEECKIVERKPIKPEYSSVSREKKLFYNDGSIKDDKNYSKDYKREVELERRRSNYKDEDWPIKREDAREIDKDRKRNVYKNDEKYRDEQRNKGRLDDDTRERYREKDKDSYGRNFDRDNYSNRERSRDRNEDIEPRRGSKKDYDRDLRLDYRARDYEERKSRHTQRSNSDGSDDDKYKGKKSKKKSKKSKKSKSKYKESSDSESSTAYTLDSEEEKRKKHKKKTKKSKKERERSRSRGRR